MKSTKQKLKNKKFFFIISSLLLSGVILFSSGIIASCLRRNDSKRLDSDSIKNNITKNFANIDLDNYKDYFIDANNKADKKNTGKMTKSIFAKMANLHENDIDAFSITKVEEREEDKGYVRLNINLTIKKSKNNLDNNNVENIEFECLTGMYDPNSKYNEDKMVTEVRYWSSGFTAWTLMKINQSSVSSVSYIPHYVETSVHRNEWVDTVKKIDFRFSNYKTLVIGAFRDNENIEELDFSGLENFLTTKNQGLGLFYTNAMRNMTKLRIVNFSYSSIEKVPPQTFYNDLNLNTVLFTGCIDLTEIGWDSFGNCSSLQSLDFSDSPIYKVDDSAFKGCINLKTIYVKDEIARAAFQQSIDSAGLSTKIIIKNN